MALAFATLASSRSTAQLTVVLHCAEACHAPDDGDLDTQQKGGPKSPDDAIPNHWDFVHIAVGIGVAAQTADVSFVSRRKRRLGTASPLDILIVALAINVLAGLF